ncbi:hypothetical protein BC828DRAFT_378508 [Blastocladiella britannica]|nr:hypothetical protein BC828DRAFT_378508 [Blastocladiella britannica]
MNVSLKIAPPLSRPPFNRTLLISSIARPHKTMDTYYFTPSEIAMSPYLSMTMLAAGAEVVTTVERATRRNAPHHALYDEETQGLLAETPVVDAALQVFPLTWAFTGGPGAAFKAPSRFTSSTETETDDVEHQDFAPDFDAAAAVLALRVRQMQSAAIDLAFPWWQAASELEVAPAAGMAHAASQAMSTTASTAQSSQTLPQVDMSCHAHRSTMVSCGTQYEAPPSADEVVPPRILIDSLVGTDEMERDLRVAAHEMVLEVLVDGVLQASMLELRAESTLLKAVGGVAATAAATPITEDVDEEDAEFEFVDASEAEAEALAPAAV